VVLCAFDLLELDGHDLRRAPIEERKATLAKLLRPPVDGIAFNEHYSGDGGVIYKHACALGCEGSFQSASVRRIGPVAPSVG
jgi:bifunctional non-homologous end joining protein LigD